MASSLGKAVLELTTDATKLEGGINAAKGKVEGWASSVGGVAKGAAIAIAGIGTAALGIIGALTASAVAVAHDAGEVSKLKRELGLTAEESSKLRYEGQRMGLDIDDLSKSFGIFSKNVDNGTKAITDNHIQVIKNSAGNVDFEATLGKVADRFKAMPDGVEKSSLAMELFGKGGKDLIPLLNQGSDGLKAMGDEAARLGLVFDDKTLAASKRLSLAQKDLKDNVEAVKTRIGTAFLPILAEWSGWLLSLANTALPKVFAGLEIFSGGVRTAIGVVREIVDVATRRRTDAGGLLAGIIGQDEASTFMATVANVSLTLNHFWELVVKPALIWLQINGPKIWDQLSTAVATAWAVIEPKLAAFGGKLEELKKKFDALPQPVKDALEQVALATVLVKASPIDDWINSATNAIQGAGGLAQAAIALKGHWAAFLLTAGTASAVLLAIASIVVAVYQIASAIGEVRDHWENVRQAVHDGSLDNSNAVEGFLIKLVQWGDMFDALGRHTQNSLAEWQIMFANFSDAVELIWPSLVLTAQIAWRNILLGIQGMVNSGIDAVNELIKALNSLPGTDLPLISHVTLELPNTTWAENEINRIARSRSVNIDIYETYHPASQNATPHALGTDRIVRTPELILVGEAGPERLTVTPLAKGTGGNGDGGHGHDIYLDGRLVGRLQGRRTMRNAALAGAPLG